MALPVTIPNTFANATSSIPLSQLDTNFSTLANAVNGLNSGSETLANLKATTANVGVLTVTGNATIGDASTDTVTLNSTLTANTAVIFAAGTSAAPSITTTGDLNTGIFFPAADTIAFAEGGVEAMRIDSSGNVGIGTISPNFTNGGGKYLDVNGGASRGNISLLTDATNADGTLMGIVIFGATTQSANHQVPAQIFGELEGATANQRGGRLSFHTKANASTVLTERMRIDSSGNVGIGTSTIEANGNANTLEITGKTSLGAAILRLKTGDRSTAKTMLFCDTGGFEQRVETAHPIVFSTNDTERARITSGGNLSVGTTSSLGRLGIQAATANNTDYGIYIQDSAAALMFYIRNDGVIQTGTKAASPYNNTTATAANMVVDSAGTLLRSTSSIKYKTQVENLDSSHADAILNFRPVWYRSLCNADNKNWSWYGLIAEEVAEVEPRLVHWGYSEEDYEVVETQEEVQKERTITGEDGVETVETYTETETKKNKQLKADAQLKPEGVQYDRLTVLLLDIVKRQDKRIEALEAEVAAMKAGNGN